MSITTFAAIDVGSNELSMKIYEISKKGINELDCIRHTIELGTDTYTYGKINNSSVKELCDVLYGFTEKMKEYDVLDCVAYATSAIREASNSLLILDQIKLRTNLKVKILSNSEQRFLCYKAIALKENAFNKIIQKGTAIVDVGAGSIQLSLFDKESLVSTQNIRLGSLRVREILADMESETASFYNLISEFMNQDIKTYISLFLQNHEIENIIAVGDNITRITNYLHTTKPIESLNQTQFDDIYSSLRLKSIESLSRELNISKEQAALILPTTMIYHKIFKETGAKFMWVPGVTLCDGIASDYALKKEKIISTHDFTQDIIAAARNIANRYHCNNKHIENVEYLALNIFDNLKKLHGLGKRERLLLQIAVILHKCGEYINMTAVYENSYHIIMSTEIIGLSHLEREITANIIRLNSENFKELHQIQGNITKDAYITISKLTAIFRIANALDISHKQKLTQVKLSIKDRELIITATTPEDITLEQGLFDNKAVFFEEVYGLIPVLKQKRSI